MYFYNDPTFLLLIPAMLLAFYAQWKVGSTYRKYALVKTAQGKNGVAVAKSLLEKGGMHGISVNAIPGELTDNYDPRGKTLNLSEAIYRGDSVAAVGIVAHEVGHALQDKEAYAPLMLRSSIVPVSNFGTTLAFPLFILGLFTSLTWLMDVGIVLFSLAVFFTLVTLPVEFNASRRAVILLRGGQYLTESELAGAKKVLNAAALTYVAATTMAILQLLRLIMMRGQRDD